MEIVFIPTVNQTAIDIEKADDGTIKLLTYREAGEAIKLAPKRVRKLIRRWQWIDTYQPVTEILRPVSLSIPLMKMVIQQKKQSN